MDCLLKMLRAMGFDLHYHEVRRLMYLVESSETSVMNESWLKSRFVRNLRGPEQLVCAHQNDRQLRN